MAALFAKRMEAAEVIAAYKQEKGLPVEDLQRERELTERNSALVPEKYRKYYVNYLQSLFSLSKFYQHSILGNTSIAYAGVEGAFAHIAAGRIFPQTVLKPYGDFATAYHAVEEGICQCAVLPIENSFAGDVGQVMDLAYGGNLSVSGIYALPLQQSLLARPGVTLQDISRVTSHPQALSQCRDYLQTMGWEQIPAANTAAAAKALADSDDTQTAVVAAAEAAEFYGLQVLCPAINGSDRNTTRFAVFTAEPCRPQAGDEAFALMFSCKDRPGALGEAISVISRYDYNLRCLKSHPTGHENWDYYFYAEGVGDLSTQEGTVMLRQLQKQCNAVKVLGSFGRERILEP